MKLAGAMLGGGVGTRKHKRSSYCRVGGETNS